MHISRRQFIKLSAIASLGLALPSSLAFDVRRAYAFYQSPGLRKFYPPFSPDPLQRLRGVGPDNIPVADTDGAAPVTGVKHYTIEIEQFPDQLHPDLGPTTLWGYNPVNPLGGGDQPQKHLGGIIVANKDEPIQITFRNKLPDTHILPVDPTIMGADGAANRTSVHLHGGLVPWISDGGPFAWWAPDGTSGDSFINNEVLNPRAAHNEAEYYYPNAQSARLLWYHDHAIGITRLNAYAGLATAYIIRDSFEADLVANKGLPGYIEAGGNEIPIVIQDKIFVSPGILTADTTWPGPITSGSLWYPHVYEGDRWAIGPEGHPNLNTNNLEQDPSNIPEMFGDTMLANGTVYPVAAVQARRYRLRILNTCQARFLNLQLYVADPELPDCLTLVATPTPIAAGVAPDPLRNPKGPDFLVIGTEGGFLSQPVLVNSAVPFDIASDSVGDPVASTIMASLLTGPAERWDVIVDFADFAGKRVVLYNDAPAPFPMGDPINDFYPGGAGNPTPGSGPNTRQIMAFDVSAVPQGTEDPPLLIDESTDLTKGINAPLVNLKWTTQPQLPPGVKVRQLTLNETFDNQGRLIQMLGTTEMTLPGTFGRHYDSPATEVVAAGSTEVWQIINLTGDTHPMHFHLANVQVLSRHTFPDPAGPTPGSHRGASRPLPNLATGTSRGPELLELGWKETVKMHPNEITTIIMRFDLPENLPFEVPESPRTGGNEYVWHCHILDHEEHDMMRPLIVTNQHHVYIPSLNRRAR